MGQPENADFLDETNQEPENTDQPDAQVVEMTPEQQAEVAADNEAKAKAEAEAKAAAKAEADAADEAALTEFKQVADERAASDDIDVATGVLPEKDRQPVLVAYSKLNQAKTKRAAKDYLRDSMTKALAKGGEDPKLFTVARGYLDLFKQVEAVATTRAAAPKVVVDPTDAHVSRVVALMLAANMATTPDGVAEDWKERANARVGQIFEQASAYREWLVANEGKDEDARDPEPENVPEEILAAVKISQGRAAGRRPRAASTGSTGATSGGGYTGARRSVSKHIAEAFAAHPVGTILSIADIAKFDSDEYGSDHPSSGAVTSALFKDNGKGDPKENVAEGIIGLHADTEGSHPKGAKKVA